MDIMTALSAAGQAIKIVKDLRNVERDLDSASYKAKMAELYDALADVKMALTDARETIHDKDQEIKELQTKIEALMSGDICPLCRKGHMKIISIQPDHVLGTLGIQARTLTCDNSDCKHTEVRQFDSMKDR